MNPPRVLLASLVPCHVMGAQFDPLEACGSAEIVSGDDSHLCTVWGASKEGAQDGAEQIARAINSHGALIAALEQAERRLSRIACGELAGMAAKHSAKSGVEEIRAATAKP